MVSDGTYLCTSKTVLTWETTVTRSSLQESEVHFIRLFIIIFLM